MMLPINNQINTDTELWLAGIGIGGICVIILWTYFTLTAPAIDTSCTTDTDCYNQCMNAGNKHKDCEIEA